MAARYWATSVNGGASGSLDSIDPTNTDGSSTALVAGDICEVIEDNMISVYQAASAAGKTEKYPDIIIPDNNAGDWYWQLINRKPRDEGMAAAIMYANTPGAF